MGLCPITKWYITVIAIMAIHGLSDIYTISPYVCGPHALGVCIYQVNSILLPCHNYYM